MAYTTINKSSEHFNTKLYTGNSGELAITGVGFQPDFWWGKKRSHAGSHILANAVSGANKFLYSDATLAETTYNEAVKSFDSDGVTIGTAGDINGNGLDFVSWNWKANGAGSSNSDATGSYPITSTVSANTTAGFSIVKYTGNGYSTAQIGHGLGSKPAMVIMRPLGYSGAWWIAHKDLTADNVLEFNTNAQANISSFGGGGLKYSTFTTSVIGGGNGSSNSDLWNKSGEDYIAYCFAEKTGYSKFGSYVGNGSSTDGSFIYTGMKPSFVMYKNTSVSGGHWQIHDTKRLGYNGANKVLRANLTNAEADDEIDILSNGFKARNASNNNNNWSGVTYLYMAFAEAPLVGNNNVPCTAR